MTELSSHRIHELCQFVKSRGSKLLPPALCTNSWSLCQGFLSWTSEEWSQKTAQQTSKRLKLWIWGPANLQWMNFHWNSTSSTLFFFTSHATSLPPPGDDWGRSWFFPSSENQNLALLPGLEGSHGWKKMTTKIGRFSDESHGSPRTTHESWFSLKLMGVSLIVVKLPFNYPANFALVMGERIKDYDVPKSKSTKNIAKTCKDSICCSPCCWQSLPAAWLNFRIQGPFSCIILSIIANGTGSILRMLLQDGPLPCYK